jgi:hypothetical protein
MLSGGATRWRPARASSPDLRWGTLEAFLVSSITADTAIAAVLAVSTTCADAGTRHVGEAPRFAAHHVKVARLSIRVAPEPSYWMYRLCSPAGRAADPYTVCFPFYGVRPSLGRAATLPPSGFRAVRTKDQLRGHQNSASGPSSRSAAIGLSRPWHGHVSGLKRKSERCPATRALGAAPKRLGRPVSWVPQRQNSRPSQASARCQRDALCSTQFAPLYRLQHPGHANRRRNQRRQTCRLCLSVRPRTS